MQQKPGQTGVTQITKQDWDSLYQGLQESNPQRQTESIQSTISYFAKENKLESLRNFCQEVLSQVEQHQSSGGGSGSASGR